MLLDANVFIQAHRLYYPLDVIPSFWDKLKEFSLDNRIISIDKVKNEIFRNDDILKEWVQVNLDNIFFNTTNEENVIVKYRELSRWAVLNENNYLKRAIDEFLDEDNADAWLISFCFNYGYTIVTEEISNPRGKSKIKIPDVCNHFNIEFINTISMLRDLHIKI